MSQGILVGFLAYGIFSCSDAFVKALGGRLSVFEIGFFAGLFALFALPFSKPASQSWRSAFTVTRPWLVLMRALTGTIAGILAVFAFTTLPLAEAYSLIFLAPPIATLLSVLLLGERIGWRRVLATIAGFCGVMLVVRPGFRELLPGHFAAIAAAVCAAGSLLMLRVLGRTESCATLLVCTMGLSVAANGIAMAFDFHWPSAMDFGGLAAAGILSGAAQILIMLAIQLAPASRIAPVQYSQIIWAVMLGAVFFREVPDAMALAGMGLVAISGLVTFLREGPKSGASVQARVPRPGGPG